MSLSTKKLTVKVGQSKKLKLKNNKKKGTTKTLGQGKVLTLYYNNKNAEEVRKQIQDSDLPVHVIVKDKDNG